MTSLRDLAGSIAVVGEEGTGKMLVAQRLVRGSQTGVVVVASDATPRRAQLLTRCREELAQGNDVIVRRIDCLAAEDLAELRSCMQQKTYEGRLIVTCAEDPSPEASRTLAVAPHRIWVPPLRERHEDIADLVPAILRELTNGRAVTVSMPALQVLIRYPWPGNVTELREVLEGSLMDSRNQIELTDLPASLLQNAQARRLTPIEQAERDTIIRALASVDNNRTEAARLLGIGRATLYRKLRSLGISSGRELAR